MRRRCAAIGSTVAATVAAAVLACLASSAAVAAAPCAGLDPERHVDGVSQCLLMRRFGAATDAEALVVWLHGDVSAGGPANYHVAAAEAAGALGPRIASVALVRPGYPDGSGESSGVALLQSGRSDHYTAENVAEVGAAIEHLRARVGARRVVVVGHSGGAATAAILLGMKPGLVDAALLVACPCDLVAWRAGRRAWTRSENPMRWTDRVPATARVVAFTGDADDNTAPALAIAYVDALKARGIDAEARVLPGQTHNGAFRAPEVGAALRTLLAP